MASILADRTGPSHPISESQAVIASEAKQSRAAKKDWIASSLTLLAMTGEPCHPKTGNSKTSTQGLWIPGLRQEAHPGMTKA
jgi:hypothetical protein